jgi:general secretion pathway protein C
MIARLVTALIWILVVASGAFWGVKLFADEAAMPAQTAAASSSAPSLPGSSDVARLLGATTLDAGASDQAPAMKSRFRLAGVIPTQQASSNGIALIAIDGKMARAFRVGAPIDGAMVLQSVGFRSANLGPAQGPPAVVLELPSPALPSSGLSPSQSAPLVASTVVSAPEATVTPATPSIRKAAPGEQVTPGRRMRLRGHLVGAVPED